MSVDTRMLKALVLLVGLAVASVLLYRARYPTYELSYMLRVEVDTPTGLRSGESVLKARIARRPSIMGDAGMSWSLEGDAVTVPLPNHDVVFATLNTDYLVRLPERVAGFSSWGGGPEMGSHWSELRARGPMTVPTNALPLLVRFADRVRPASVVKVKPFDMSAHFGPGYALRAVTVTATDAPVTRTVDRWLPWLKDYRRRQLDGSVMTSSPPTFANSLSSSNFRM